MKPPACVALGLLLAGLGAVGAEGPLPPQEHVLDYEARPQRNVIPDADIPTGFPEEAAAPKARPWQDEEDALWALVRDRRLDVLDAEIARMRDAWPDWNPPERLLALAAEARIRQAIGDARGRGDDRGLIRLAGEHPGYFGCRDLGNAWALAEALERIEGTAEAAAVYRRLLGACQGTNGRIANLRKLRPLIPPVDFLEILNRAGDSDPTLAASPAYERMQRESRREVAAHAADQGDFDGVVAALEPAAPGIEAERDTAAAALLAWGYARTGRPTEALAWEERLAAWGARRGSALAQARLAAGDPEGALEAAEAAAPNDPEAARLAFGLRSERATDAQDCQARMDELAAAERWGELNPDQRRMRAWSLHDCGRHAEAAERFAGLYRETGSDDDARGVVVSNWQARQLEVAETLAEQTGGPLAARLPEEALPMDTTGIDYARLSLSDDGRVEVLHQRGWSAWAGAGFISRQGDGPGRLDAWRAPLLRASLTEDVNAWRIDLDRLDLESDPAAAGDWPLNVAVPYTPRTDTTTDGIEGRISWRRDRQFAGGGLDIEAALGFTPTGQDIDATWTGRLAAGRGAGRSGWTVALERDSVRESITSWTGTGGHLTVDGTTYALPFDWGRVTRSGLEFSGYSALGTVWTLGGSVKAGFYEGENVPDNTGGELYALLQRSLWAAGAWRLSAGPWLYASAFEKNLGRFSPGHGGYFSPAWLAQSGLAGRLTGSSAESPWTLDARLDLGWQRHKEDAADLIPDAGLERRFLATTGLAPESLGRFEARTRSGFAGGVELEGMRRIGNTVWHVGGLVSARFAPQYDEATAMLVFRYGSEPSATDQRADYRELILERR